MEPEDRGPGGWWWLGRQEMEEDSDKWERQDDVGIYLGQKRRQSIAREVKGWSSGNFGGSLKKKDEGDSNTTKNRKGIFYTHLCERCCGSVAGNGMWVGTSGVISQCRFWSPFYKWTWYA